MNRLWFIIFVISTSCMSCSFTKKLAPSSSDEVTSAVIPYDDTRPGHWPEPFQKVQFPSPLDGEMQNAWYHSAEGSEPRPLLVSLHTWSGDYNQKDTLAQLAAANNWNYIHPDFRGPNWTSKACCSKYALEDIDQAIDFAIQQGNVDRSRIYVNGVSGGGYAALAVYMRSRHPIRSILAWVPISDLVAWYEQSDIRGANYAGHILDCTGSQNGVLDTDEALTRSPLYWETPRRETRLRIYAGVYDGIRGSVPITHSINFYNKVIRDLGEVTGEVIVSDAEKAWLLEHRKPMDSIGTIGNRKICLRKRFQSVELVIFEGNHEMLVDVAAQNIFN